MRDKVEELECRHRRGYERFPVGSDEFSVWEVEQAWGDETTTRYINKILESDSVKG